IEKRNKRKRVVEDTNSIEILNLQQEFLLTDKSKASSKKRIC
ncbi:486_t:CDS:1, partial [Funneliformis caledonium]